MPAQDTPSQQKSCVTKVKLPPCGFSVSGGKKGSLPLRLEKRPKGKKVTIISNVQGNANSLLSTLSSLLGIGGTARQQPDGIHWTVEVQGDQAERVAPALAQLGCLRGVQQDVANREKQRTVAVATRVCAYDKFLRRKEPDRDDFKADILPFAQSTCTGWHGPWIYCSGHCQREDLSDVWNDHIGQTEEGPKSGLTTRRTAFSLPELNEALHDLFMLPQVGEAARLGIRPRRKHPPSAAATGLITLEQYRCQALNPGARLIIDEPVQRRAPRKVVTTSKASYKSSKPVSKQKPLYKAAGPCSLCGCVYELERTLRLHWKNAHPGTPWPTQRAPRRVVAAPTSQSSTNEKPKLQGTWRLHRCKKASGNFDHLIDGSKNDQSACPVCFELISQEDIEEHVNNCLSCTDTHWSEVESSDEEDIAPIPTPNLDEPLKMSTEGARSNFVANEMSNLPQDWLESFLMLELSDSQASSFWSWFESFRQEQSLENAWLRALELACTHSQDAIESVSVGVDLLDANPARTSCTWPSEADWQEVAVIMQPEDQVTDCSSNQPTMMINSQLGIEFPRCSDSLASVESAPHVRCVISAWSPIDDSQVEVVAGDSVVVEWEQPPQEGGFWAYVHVLPVKKDSFPGYIPIQCLEPLREANYEEKLETESCPTNKRDCERSTTSRWQRARRKSSDKENTEETSAAGAINAFTPQPILVHDVSEVRKQEFHALAPTFEEKPKDTLSVQCPVCSLEFPTDEIDKHAGRCLEVKRRGGDVLGLSSNNQTWALSKLAKLAKQHCAYHIDEVVAVAALSACNTKTELQSEAEAIIGCYKEVKKFADELWERKVAASMDTPLWCRGVVRAR